MADRVTRAIGAAVLKPSVNAGKASCRTANHHSAGCPARSVSMSMNPVTRGGKATPIGKRPTGPGSRCRFTKKIPISTRPTQNCGSAMPLSVAPRTRKSGQRSRFTAAITPSGMPTIIPSVSPTRPSSNPRPRSGRW